MDREPKVTPPFVLSPQGRLTLTPASLHLQQAWVAHPFCQEVDTGMTGSHCSVTPVCAALHTLLYSLVRAAARLTLSIKRLPSFLPHDNIFNSIYDCWSKFLQNLQCKQRENKQISTMLTRGFFTEEAGWAQDVTLLSSAQLAPLLTWADWHWAVHLAHVLWHRSLLVYSPTCCSFIWEAAGRYQALSFPELYMALMLILTVHHCSAQTWVHSPILPTPVPVRFYPVSSTLALACKF